MITFSKRLTRFLLAATLTLFSVSSLATEITSAPIVLGILYGIAPDGTLKWYSHDGAELGDGVDHQGSWRGPKDVGWRWQGYKQVFAGTGTTIYGIQNDGALIWYSHDGFFNGESQIKRGAWSGGKRVGIGWQKYKYVFGMDAGVIYAIAYDGTLYWYKHNGFKSGDNLTVPGAWEGPKAVGQGWNKFKFVFSGCNGIIYGVTNSGELRWYKHKGYLNGDDLTVPGAWEGPKTVGTNWSNFKNVFSVCNGVIYGVATYGTLKWYRHYGAKTGDDLTVPGAWNGPHSVGFGWQNFNSVFGLLLENTDPSP